MTDKKKQRKRSVTKFLTIGKYTIYKDPFQYTIKKKAKKNEILEGHYSTIESALTHLLGVLATDSIEYGDLEVLLTTVKQAKDEILAALEKKRGKI